jgi:predicted nucleotide-binding protein with TIR-like domain
LKMVVTTPKPRVFIGSSTTGASIARAVEQNLNHNSETYLWPHMFPQGKSNLESLVAAASTHDFAVLVLTPDDLTESKGSTMQSPRDNVLFELGLFMGRLGRERTFAVYNHDESVKLPSDLAGVTLASYPKYRGKNLAAQVSVACTPILNAIDSLGPLTHSPEINPSYDFDLMRLDGKFKLIEVISQKTVMIVVGDGLVSELLDRPVAGILRDEIGRWSGGDSFKRAIIIGHCRWTQEASICANPTIAIGGEPANKLSGEILQARRALGKERFEEGPGGWGAFAPAIPASPAVGTSPARLPVGPRIALWGVKAAETRIAVETYILRTAGLQHFLNDHAGWKTA